MEEMLEQGGYEIQDAVFAALEGLHKRHRRLEFQPCCWLCRVAVMLELR